jgi:hypothetical protein
MCAKCQNNNCNGCGSNAINIENDCGCNNIPCLEPAPCSYIVPAACIQYVGEDKSCDGQVVYAKGDTIGVIEGKIVDYFCERLTEVITNIEDSTTIVTEVSCGEEVVYETGYTIIEALKQTVGYFCTRLSDVNDVINGLALVASSGAYSDLSGVPTMLSDFTNDLLTADELAAINGASAPSATNLFITQDDLATVATTGDYNDLSNLPTIENIGNTNLDLTGNRTLNGGGFSLTFTGQSAFSIISPSASVSDTAFEVKNNTNSYFKVLGDGSVYSSGKNNAIEDTVYGYSAGSNMGVGAYFNTFFGFQAGSNVTGAACVAVGKSAMQEDSTFSTAIGAQALVNGGSYMVAIGSNASRIAGNSLGVIIGTDAAYVLANGQKNIIIGWSSATSMTTGSNNIILGNYNNANPSTLVTGNKNTLIGDEQWDFPATMKGSVVLGYRAKATGDNQFSVGSSTENAGAVITEGFTQALTWTVKINGVDYKIPLQLA